MKKNFFTILFLSMCVITVHAQDTIFYRPVQDNV